MKRKKRTKGEKRRAAIRDSFKAPSAFNSNFIWIHPNICKFHGVKYVKALEAAFEKDLGAEPWIQKPGKYITVN